MSHSDYSHFHQYRIQESLKDLYRSLQTLGIPLLFRHGEVKECLDEIQLYYHIKGIYAHEETGNNLTFIRDKAIIQYCKENHIEFLEYPSN
jgi:deoxyribodipyrimidine photo-lyase